MDSAETPSLMAWMSFRISRSTAASSLATVRQAGAVLHPQPIHLARELVAELLEQILAQQLVPQRLEHALFDFLAADGQAIVHVPRDARRSTPAGRAST